MVQGLAEMHHRWGAVPEKVRAAARRAMEDVATQLVAEMRALAPKRSGRLARSINWTWGDAPAGSLTIGTVGGLEYGAMRITIYAGGKAAYWARFQEFGTVKMAAHPFFYPVWRTRRRGAKSKITRAINKAIRAT